jgi:predicted nucleic-acid-binding Zn-ribbon protein
MDLSKDHREAFQQWYSIVGNKMMGCPVCGHTSTLEDMLARADIVRFDSRDKPDEEARFVTVRCGQCGGVQLFSASHMGIQV